MKLRHTVAYVAMIAALAIPQFAALAGTEVPAYSSEQPDAAHGQEIICPKCHHPNRPGTRFCTECGTVLQTGGCPRCGAEVHQGDKFCAQCGLNLVAVSKPGAQPPAQGPPAIPPAPAAAAQEPEVIYPTLKIGGFHDFGYTGESTNSPHNFSLGQFVLHTNSLLARNVQFFSELSFTPRADAGVGSPAAPGYNMDVERAILRYDQSDQLRLSGGRYHTPINWWNTAFHHGLWLQTSIARPEMIKFGGVFLPVHFVGGLVEGSTPLKGVDVNYKLGLGNGRGAAVSRAGDFGDNNSSLAWLADFYVRPEKLYGFQVGGSVYNDMITLSNGKQFREWITSAHIVLERETPEFIAEYAHVNHKPAGAPSFSSDGYYIQLAYRLPDALRRFKPYVRYERLSIPSGEPVYTAQPNLRGTLGGIRFDFADFAALKLEYRDFRRSVLPNSTGFFSQVSYTF